jgi:hypothetical protein
MSPSRALLGAAATSWVAAACLLLPSSAAAQGGLTLRSRVMAGYTHERPESLGSEHDHWVGTIPEVSVLFVEPRWLLRTAYAVTLAAHTRNANEIAQRLTLASSYELSRRTVLLLSAEANQSTLSNYLLTRPTGSTVITALPLANTNTLTTTVGQGIAWEASPRVLFGQSADAAYVRSLDPALQLESKFVNVGVSVEHLWKRDAVGADLRAGYATTDAPPLPETAFYTFTAAPRWRHDISDALSSSLTAGATAVVSPDDRTDPIVVPSGRAALLYTVDATSAELSYAAGIFPNLLSGQLLRSHQVTLRAGMPISERHGVNVSGSVGFMRGQVVVLAENTPSPPDFDAFLSDADISWLATDNLLVFGRYQFFGQFGGPGAQFLREAFIVGVQLSSRAPDGVRVPTAFAQRVDRSDAAPRR